MSFTTAERRVLLREYFALARRAEDEGPDEEITAARERLSGLVRRYEEMLPRVPLSRCPLSGQLVLHTFDPLGLDGLWWNCEAPARPLLERFVTCVAVTGAVHLAQEVEWFPFLCKPGPGAPYVVPRLLGLDGVCAVIYSLPVGRHTAYAILYFAAGPLNGLSMPNTWGTDTYWDDLDGQPGWYAAPDAPQDWDFELLPWIERKKLFWIAPGDPDMALRQGTSGCPYLDLEGARQVQRITNGKVRLDSDFLDIDEQPQATGGATAGEPGAERSTSDAAFDAARAAGPHTTHQDSRRTHTMSDFVFFELKPEVRQELKLPPHPIPVRRDRQQQVFLPGGVVDFPVMLDEVRIFLDENPDLEADYAQLLAMLALINGMDVASQGLHAQALPLYELGLDAVPGSIALRSHYALALKCLGRDVEARREIEAVIAATPKDTILPVLWMILARLYAHDGEHEKAYWLLKDVSALVPAEEGFWDLLREMGEKSGHLPRAKTASAPAAPTVQQPAVAGMGGGAAIPPVAPGPVAAPAPPEWHYAQAGQARGPVGDSVLRGMLARNELDADTQVWNATLPGWITALASGLVAAPAATPSPPPGPVPGRCPRCAAQNESSARFCSQCGTPLP